jgi:hypothetical protein
MVLRHAASNSAAGGDFNAPGRHGAGKTFQGTSL